MPYQALYRKYRSQTFADVVGQEAITRTLRNAIIHGKISHAYLFNGPRGTGKTSCAKIFAKAINCPHQKDGEPCNNCDICESITKGSLNDVIEIDAASNNGVEEIREIRDKAKYAPTVTKYKVYIIDEVHMLSKGAFNALLKTLEEPPQNVVFILATTEPHKIPATIISRVQRFDFKRIPNKVIENHLRMILDDLSVKYDDDSLKVIAQIAEGGMRDALSILDQVLAFSEQNEITLQDTLNITGSLTSQMMFDYLQACLIKDSQKALSTLTNILSEGREASRIVEDLIVYLRDLLLYLGAQVEPSNQNILAEFKQLQSILQDNDINRYIDLIFKTQENMKSSSNQIVYLEMMTLELCSNNSSSSQINNELLLQINELTSKVQDLEEQLKNISVVGAVDNASTEESFEVPSFKTDIGAVEQILNKAERSYLDEMKEAWMEILNILNEYQRALVQPNHTIPVAASVDGVVLSSKVEVFARKIVNDKDLMQSLKQAMRQIVNRDVEIEFVLESEWGKIRADFLQRRKQQTIVENIAEADDNSKQPNPEQQAVEKAKEIFGTNLQILDD